MRHIIMAGAAAAAILAGCSSSDGGDSSNDGGQAATFDLQQVDGEWIGTKVPGSATGGYTPEASGTAHTSIVTIRINADEQIISYPAPGYGTGRGMGANTCDMAYAAHSVTWSFAPEGWTAVLEEDPTTNAWQYKVTVTADDGSCAWYLERPDDAPTGAG